MELIFRRDVPWILKYVYNILFLKLGAKYCLPHIFVLSEILKYEECEN